MKEKFFQTGKRFLATAIVALIPLTAATLSNEVHAQARIAVSVNNGVVTQYQVTQRSRFLRLTGVKSKSVERARKELVDEELQFQEGRRIGINIPDSAVDREYARIARSVGVSARQFSAGLRERGVNPSTLKERLKSQILWREIVIARSRAEATPTRQRVDITTQLFRGENRTLKEYTLERFVFVVKRDAPKKVVRQKIREAEAFRKRYKSCIDAGERAKALNGIVVTKLGRFTEETLPADIRDEVLAADIGSFTKPQKGELGVGMMAVCQQREIVDSSQKIDSFSTGQLSSEELIENSKKWLAELRDRATIRNRN